jgi:hypothetical protein
VWVLKSKVMQNIIELIQKYSLTVRCLPYQVVNHWSYSEGDEHKEYVDSKGNPIESKREVIIQHLDLEYFQKTDVKGKWNAGTPEERFKRWKDANPNGKKILRETKEVEHGGWWYIKPTKNTDSTVVFNRDYDKFFAPTLEEAMNLFLESIGEYVPTKRETDLLNEYKHLIELGYSNEYIDAHLLSKRYSSKEINKVFKTLNK